MTTEDGITATKETLLEKNYDIVVIKEGNCETTKKCSIEWRTVPLKLIYFIFNGGMILVWPFIPNYLISLGMTTWEIGTIQGIMPFLGLISKIIISYVADRYNAHKTILSACIMLWAVGYELMLFIPSSSPLISSDNNNVSLCSERPSNVSLAMEELSQEPKRHPSLFIYAFMSLMLVNLAFAPIFSLFDAMSFNVVSRIGSTSSFGAIRAWAAAGYMIFSPVSGMGMTHLGKVHDSYYIRVHINALLCFITMGIIIFLLKLNFGYSHRNESKSETENQSSRESEETGLKRLSILFESKRLWFFIFNVFIFGVLGGYHETFYQLFLEEEVRSSQAQIGITMAIGTFSEMMFMFVSERILQRLKQEHALVIVHTVFFLRFLAYRFLTTWTTSPWVTCPIDLAHGVTFGLMWAASASSANAMAPAGMTATLQGLVGALYYNLGRGIGTLGGGLIQEAVGGRQAFFFLSFIALFTGTSFVIFLCLSKTRGNKDVEAEKTHGKEMDDIACETA